MKLLFGVHMHQPVDNFTHVVDEAIERCYKPFFETIAEFPEFKLGVHCSGWLFEQIENRSKGLFGLIRDLTEAGVIEFLTSGYYEPILPAIPSKDRRGQIKMLSEHISKKFLKYPSGLWLTERVWDECIVSDVVASGISYVLVDDYHFICAGFDYGELNGYYLTESGGDRLAVFPISKELRYSIPFSMPEEAIDKLKKRPCAVIFDDVEKFGLWPETYDWVYEKKWLEKFLRMLVEDEDVVPMHYGEYVERFSPLGVAYLPSVSYYEMGEWSLKPGDALKIGEVVECVRKEFGEDVAIRFVKGGVWKNFMVKYSESNYMHKRMLEVSGRQKRDKKFKNELYKTQTNDVFWHGIFGGLYLPNLRDNFFKHLISCENMLNAQSGVFKMGDFNFDGCDEVKLISNNEIYVFSSMGGQMLEFDRRDRAFNFQNTLTRRKEFYHEKMLGDNSGSGRGISTIHNMPKAMGDSLREAIVYDWYDRHSFIDHITNTAFSVKNFEKCSFREFGDFANMPFGCDISAEEVKFTRHGGVYIDGKYDTVLNKVFWMEDGLCFSIGIETDYRGELRYVCEFNFHFANVYDITINGVPFRGATSFTGDELVIGDPFTETEIIIWFDVVPNVHIFAVETVSQNERGFEKTPQGIAIGCEFGLLSSLKLKGNLRLRYS